MKNLLIAIVVGKDVSTVTFEIPKGDIDVTNPDHKKELVHQIALADDENVMVGETMLVIDLERELGFTFSQADLIMSKNAPVVAQVNVPAIPAAAPVAAAPAVEASAVDPRNVIQPLPAKGGNTGVPDWGAKPSIRSNHAPADPKNVIQPLPAKGGNSGVRDWGAPKEVEVPAAVVAAQQAPAAASTGARW